MQILFKAITSRWKPLQSLFMVRRFANATTQENKENKSLTQQHLQLIYALIKKGYDLKIDLDWKALVIKTKAELKQIPQMSTAQGIDKRECLEKTNEILKQGTMRELSDLLRSMANSGYKDEAVANAVKVVIAEEAEKGYFPELCFILRHIAILSSVKDPVFIAKVEPIIAANLDKMSPLEILKIIKAFKEWNHISEPVYSKLIRTALDSPHTLGLECLIYLAYTIQEQGINSPKLHRHILSYTINCLNEISKESPKEVIKLLPPKTISILIISLAKRRLLSYKEGRQLEDIVIKYMDLIVLKKNLI